MVCLKFLHCSRSRRRPWHGHATLSPHLKRSQYSNEFEFFDSWYPVAVWICTRKRDGAAAEVCRFDALDDDEDSINGYGSGPYGNITFYNKQLNLPREMEGLSDQGWEVMEYFDEVHSGATLCIDTWSLRRWSLT